MAFLELTGVQKRFPGGVVAVEDFNLGADRGEFVSFLGPSGCGKTTTLRMIAGFEQPTAGRIVLDGQDITHRPPNRRNVGMVFQSYALFPNMTVASNIAFGLKLRGRSKDQIATRVTELLKLIHLEGRGDRYPYQLSGGQQQRVALARALAIEPSVLLLDEPLSALDAKIRVTLRHEIRSIQRQLGITTVYVTHDQEEALELSDRVVVMSEGRMEQVGTPFEIYNFPSTTFVASFVGTLNQLETTIVDGPGGVVAVDGQQIRTGRAVTATAGATVPISIRPEMLSVATGGSAANLLQGRVHEVRFLGSIVRVDVAVGRKHQVISMDVFSDPNLTVPERGSDITVAFPPEACLVLGDGGAGNDHHHHDAAADLDELDAVEA
jgi:putative spermidine/putrescine transport system ATP-binding protein